MSGENVVMSECVLNPPEGMLNASLRSRPKAMSAFLDDLKIELDSHIEGAPPALRLDHRTLPEVIHNLSARLHLNAAERALIGLISAPRLASEMGPGVEVFNSVIRGLPVMPAGDFRETLRQNEMLDHLLAYEGMRGFDSIYRQLDRVHKTLWAEGAVALEWQGLLNTIAPNTQIVRTRT